jgi:hypothetical protein
MPAHPFGAPDAATADLDLDQLWEQYVNIDGTLTPTREAAIPRVVFGRKGSGKSHYLRALNALKARDPSVLAYGPSTDPPPHDWVIRLSMALQREAIPTWEMFWQKAILASAATTLLSRSHDATDPRTEQLALATRQVLGIKQLPVGPLSPFGAARHILTRSGSLEQFQAILGRPQWQEVEDGLATLVTAAPPLYFFLDNLDAVDSFAPRPWHSCQRGLLEAVLHLAEDPRWRRIHTVVALKDTVVQALLNSVHGQKYVHSPWLHRLEWSAEQSQEFMRRKIGKLDSLWYAALTPPASAAEWLGRDVILNDVRHMDEQIEAYLLRHTLLLPRDVVEMGNCICEAIEKAHTRGRVHLTDDEVRAAVNRAAIQIGKTGVYGAGIEVARRLMPSEAPLHGVSGAYGVTDVDEIDTDGGMTRAISEEYAMVLTLGVKAIKRDRFGVAALDNLHTVVRQKLPHKEAQEEATGALWRLGMIGVIEGQLESGQAHFYGHSEHDSWLLPDAERFALHPSMIDYAGAESIRAVGEPVYPEPAFLAALGVLAPR